MRVISGERVPIKMWLDYLEDGAEAQAKNLAALPFAFHHVAIMPDAHQGYGMPIGGVLATKGVVIPNAVGVDIGCGMCALKMPLTELNIDDLKRIVGKIRETIPVGRNHRQEAIAPMPDDRYSRELPIVEREWASAEKQLGTLGGGNHFIEVQEGDDGHIWAMIHSGSRNLGLKVANHYNEQAKKLNAKWVSSIPLSWDLAFLPLDSAEGVAYLAEMEYCVQFALMNRIAMMQCVCDAFESVLGRDAGGLPENSINIAHNYAALENHYNQNVLIHRKGATRAREGEIGIIPGSQGTKSYIVRGLGNPESFQSCSHGAGRKMSRTKASATLDLAAEIAAMDERGIVHGIQTEKDLDEAPGAYKSIDEVMAFQTDLVTPIVTLTPRGVVKG